MSFCLAPKNIFTEKKEIKYMYREKPDNKDDSGWRFFAGDETDEFVNNSENIGLYDLNNIIKLDTSLPADLMSKPFGCAYEKINGVWVLVKDDTINK